MIQNNNMGKFLSIDKFTGMDDGGTFWMQGFSPVMVGTESVLQAEGHTYHRISENTSGFSAMENFYGMTNFFYGSENTRVLTAPGGNGRIYEFNDTYDDDNLGLIHDATLTGPGSASIYWSVDDIMTTSEVNVLYTRGYYCGYGIRGQCSGTSTTTIQDEDGRNFETLGLGTDAWNNKVYNISTGEEHTITSITDGSATKDVLNFTAGSSTNTANDYFIAFSDIGQYNAGNYWDFFATTVYPHFKGQEAINNFKRQIKLFNNKYLIGNGNYLASVGIENTTTNVAEWDDNYKELPANTQFQCMGVNQGRLLVGGETYDKGKLMLWDGYSDGWLSIIELPYPPKSIQAYGSGWVYFYNSTLYYTDGYTIQKLSTIPDRNNYATGTSTRMNGIVVIDNRVHIIVNSSTFKRDKQGVWVYEINKGWNYHPITNGVGEDYYNVNNYCLSQIGSQVIGLTTNGSATNSYSIFLWYGSGSETNEVIYKLNLDGKRNIKRIGLKVSFANKDYASSTTDSCDITVSVGNNKKAFWKQFQSATSSTTTSLINAQGASVPRRADVGDMLISLEGDTGGERIFVTAITNAGTTSETYAVSPALSKAPVVNTRFNIVNLQKVDKKTINLYDIPENIFYDITGLYTDNFYVSVLTEGTNDIQIEQIDIYD